MLYINYMKSYRTIWYSIIYVTTTDLGTWFCTVTPKVPSLNAHVPPRGKKPRRQGGIRATSTIRAKRRRGVGSIDPRFIPGSVWLWQQNRVGLPCFPMFYPNMLGFYQVLPWFAPKLLGVPKKEPSHSQGAKHLANTPVFERLGQSHKVSTLKTTANLQEKKNL